MKKIPLVLVTAGLTVLMYTLVLGLCQNFNVEPVVPVGPAGDLVDSLESGRGWRLERQVIDGFSNRCLVHEGAGLSFQPTFFTIGLYYRVEDGWVEYTHHPVLKTLTAGERACLLQVRNKTWERLRHGDGESLSKKLEVLKGDLTEIKNGE